MTSSDVLQVAESAVGDPEMLRILQEMLDNDEKITARAVARKHSEIGHASSITRSSARSELLARFQEQQAQYRAWRARSPKRSKDQLASQLAQKDVRIAELERQVEVLRLSHIAMIRAVGELGGMSKLLKLYEGYSIARRELVELGVLPAGQIAPFPVGKRPPNSFTGHEAADGAES